MVNNRQRNGEFLRKEARVSRMKEKEKERQEVREMDQTFKHFSHTHGLVFHQLQHGSQVQCSGCKTPGSGNVYVCWQCSYFLHEQCYRATRSLKNPLHPLHPLTLVPYPTHQSNTFFCNTCNLVGNGLSYCCAECDFDLHVHCANMTNPTPHLSPSPLSNPNHQNPVYPPIQNNPFPNYPPHNPTIPDVSHPQNTTYPPIPDYPMNNPPLPQSDPFPAFPQPNPTGLPNFNPQVAVLITNPSPPSQPNPIQPIYTPPLTATAITPTTQPNPPLPIYTPPPQPNPPLPIYTPPPQPNPPVPTYTPPPQPQPNPPLPTYTHPASTITINPNPPPPVSQPNPVQPPQNNIPGPQQKPPTLIKHFSHPHVLKPMDIDKKNVKVCSACECELFGSAYCCTEANCNFNLHKACFDSPREVRHKCHLEHPLTLLTAPPYSDGFTCNACLKEGKAFAYNCATCSYDLHIDCITWPETVTRQDHTHALNLYYSSPSANLNQEVVFMCDVCKNPVHEMAWVYYCRECDYGTHLECVASGMQANVNLGKTDEAAISETELAFAMLQLLLNGGRGSRD